MNLVKETSTMGTVDIRICEIGDPPAFPEIRRAFESECMGFAILEKGTTNGKTSCAILARGKDGFPVMVQFTGDMFLTMAAALKGAKERFGDPWDGV
jgi:hypothetical protein